MLVRSYASLVATGGAPLSGSSFGFHLMRVTVPVLALATAATLGPQFPRARRLDWVAALALLVVGVLASRFAAHRTLSERWLVIQQASWPPWMARVRSFEDNAPRPVEVPSGRGTIVIVPTIDGKAGLIPDLPAKVLLFEPRFRREVYLDAHLERGEIVLPRVETGFWMVTLAVAPHPENAFRTGAGGYQTSPQAYENEGTRVDLLKDGASVRREIPMRATIGLRAPVLPDFGTTREVPALRGSPTFTWDPVIGATAYNCDVLLHARGVSTAAATAKGSESNCTIKLPRSAPSETYSLYVTAEAATGIVGSMAHRASFTVVE